MTRTNPLTSDVSDPSLAALCERITQAYTSDPSSVSGATIAHLAKQLVAAEIAPGGPYRDTSGHPTPALNAMIGYLFLLMKHPLPNIDIYLAGVSSTKLTKRDREALKQYEAAKHTPSSRKIPSNQAPYLRARATLATLDEPVRTQALEFLARVERADTTDEIASIAQFTLTSIGATLPAPKLRALSEANIHSWIAYTIYDHILDGETDIALLSTANICMRLAFDMYRRVLLRKHPLQTLITEYFNTVDTASAWELASCRAKVANDTIHIATLPDYEHYETLAKRSCIHILGPLVVGSLALPPKKQQHLTEGLHHYLIARQLSDDMHDWREDLARGHISAVVSILLARQDVHPNTSYDITDLTTSIQNDFLQSGAQYISKVIMQHTRDASRHLIAAGCSANSELAELVVRLDHMAKAAIDQQSRFLEFQHEYSGFGKIDS